MAFTEIAELESLLGHQFRDPRWLHQALMHSSRIPERAACEPEESNEKLEFLGDAVLELIVSEELVREFPDWSEGQLSKSRARLVNATAISLSAQRLGVGKYLLLGRGEEKTGGREKQTLLADAFEAVVGGIYLDAGLGPAREVLRRLLFEQALEERGERISESDRKSALQEFLQGRGRAPAEYRLAGESGPDHQKVFVIDVWVDGQCRATGEGSTKKEAEQRAARRALEELEREDTKG